MNSEPVGEDAHRYAIEDIATDVASKVITVIQSYTIQSGHHYSTCQGEHLPVEPESDSRVHRSATSHTLLEPGEAVEVVKSEGIDSHRMSRLLRPIVRNLIINREGNPEVRKDNRRSRRALAAEKIVVKRRQL